MDSMMGAFVTLLLAILLHGSTTSATDSQCDLPYSCFDCSTSQVCRPTLTGELVLYKPISCPVDAPYCQFESGSCGPTPNLKCGEEDDFVCLGEGYYPDSSDCRVYHYCDQLISHKFNCTIPGQTYNPTTHQCEYGLPCKTFQCPGRGRKVPNDHDPAYFAYCESANASLVVDRCPPYNGLNVTSQICEPHCILVGVIPRFESCQDYYECQNVNIGGENIMTRELKTCAEGTGFDLGQFNCVPLPEVENEFCVPPTSPSTEATTFTFPSN